MMYQTKSHKKESRDSLLTKTSLSVKNKITGDLNFHDAADLRIKNSDRFVPCIYRFDQSRDIINSIIPQQHGNELSVSIM